MLLSSAAAQGSDFTDAIKGGRAPASMSEQLERRFAASPKSARDLNWAVSRYLEGKAAKDPEGCARLVEIVLRVGALAAQRKPDDLEHQLVRADALLVEARWRRASKRGDWTEAWRAGAQHLVDWQAAGGHRWARVRAVQILLDGACLDGAPADEWIAAARALVPDGASEAPSSPASLPYLAFQVGYARYLVEIQKRKGDAKAALQPFAQIADALAGPEADKDLATVYNDAAVLEKTHKLGLKLDLITAPLDAASLTLAVPLSRRWIVVDNSVFDAEIHQLTADGHVRRTVRIFNLPKNSPRADGTARKKDLKQRARWWAQAAKRPLAKVKRERKPSRKRLNKNIKNCAQLEVSGWSGDGCYQLHRYFFFRGKRLPESFGTILTVTYGKGADKADAVAFLNGIRDG